MINAGAETGVGVYAVTFTTIVTTGQLVSSPHSPNFSIYASSVYLPGIFAFKIYVSSFEYTLVTLHLGSVIMKWVLNV